MVMREWIIHPPAPNKWVKPRNEKRNAAQSPARAAYFSSSPPVFHEPFENILWIIKMRILTFSRVKRIWFLDPKELNWIYWSCCYRLPTSEGALERLPNVYEVGDGQVVSEVGGGTGQRCEIFFDPSRAPSIHWSTHAIYIN